MSTYRTAIGAIALISLFGLTGAKAQGCGGTVETEPEPSPCGPGAHLEEICVMECYESSEPGGGGGCTETCEETCVPDEICPAGTVEQTICAEPLSSDSSGSDCFDGDCLEPPAPGDCWTECVPVGPCGPGFREQWVCEPEPLSGSGDEPAPPPEDCFDEDCLDPPSPEDCWLECVPVGVCEPGFHEEWVCDPMPEPVPGSEDEPVPPPSECYPMCVPDLCPPGMPAIETCVQGPNGELDCWTECGDSTAPSAS